MSGIQILGIKKLQRNLSLMEREVFPKAASMAINRAATRARTETVRRTARSMGLKQKDVRSRTGLRKVTPSSLDRGARLILRGSPLNLIRFGARQIKKGVSARPWGKRKVHPGTFIVVKGQARFVAKRKREGGRRVGRSPIEAVHGPGVAKSAAAPEVTEARNKVVQEALPAELRRQLDRLVARLPK